MRLYFLRHGIAQERAPGMPDEDRQLVPEGIEKITHLAQRLDDLDVHPTAIYSSPLIRAHQTAQIIADYTGVDVQIADSLAFNFNQRAMQELADRHAENDDLMVVGHEPTFSDTISYIIGGGNITMKKGGLARIDLFSQHPLYGTLVWLISPKVL